jgi:hypothetical protein
MCVILDASSHPVKQVEIPITASQVEAIAVPVSSDLT